MNVLNSSRYSGVIVAMNSCYDSNGRIHPEGSAQVADWLISKGIHGLYVGGGTGEGMLQSVKERKKVLEAVIGQVKGRIPVIAHIGAITTADSITLAQHAEAVGADAISSIPPYYYAYTEAAVKEHWFTLMDQVNLPFIIYNVPAATGFTMTPRFLKQLLEHPRLAGIKTTSFSTYDLEQFKSVGGPSFLVFNGPDQQYLAGRVMGANGGIGGTYGVMPELFLEIERAFRANDLQTAQHWQVVVNYFITEMREIGLFAAIKALIRMRDLECGEPRLPLPALQEQQKPRLHKLYEDIMEQIDLIR